MELLLRDSPVRQHTKSRPSTRTLKQLKLDLVNENVGKRNEVEKKLGRVHDGMIKAYYEDC